MIKIIITILASATAVRVGYDEQFDWNWTDDWKQKKADGWEWKLSMFPNNNWNDPELAYNWITKKACKTQSGGKANRQACTDWLWGAWVDFADEWVETHYWPCRKGLFKNSAGVIVEKGEYCLEE